MSKPIAEPFNDGSKCLVRALCAAMPSADPGIELDVLGVRGQLTRPAGAARVIPLYSRKSAFSPSVLQNARALIYLSHERRAEMLHFVFAPNERASKAVRWLRRLRPKPCIQTIASPPRDFENVQQLLFGDVVVAQSEWTRRQIERHAPQVAPRVEVILPPLGALDEPSVEQQQAVRARLGISASASVLVYPGDLEFSRGAERVAQMASLAKAAPGQLPKELTIVFACRHKTAQAESIERQLREELRGCPVVFAGELESLQPLLATASAVLFPVEQLFGKVDIPIALLESARFGTPLLVADSGPVSELQGALRLDSDRPEEWLALARRLLNDDALRARVRAEQKSAVSARHGAVQVARRYAQLYARLWRQAQP